MLCLAGFIENGYKNEGFMVIIIVICNLLSKLNAYQKYLPFVMMSVNRILTPHTSIKLLSQD